MYQTTSYDVCMNRGVGGDLHKKVFTGRSQEREFARAATVLIEFLPTFFELQSFCKCLQVRKFLWKTSRFSAMRSSTAFTASPAMRVTKELTRFNFGSARNYKSICGVIFVKTRLKKHHVPLSSFKATFSKRFHLIARLICCLNLPLSPLKNNNFM